MHAEAMFLIIEIIQKTNQFKVPEQAVRVMARKSRPRLWYVRSVIGFMP